MTNPTTTSGPTACAATTDPATAQGEAPATIAEVVERAITAVVGGYLWDELNPGAVYDALRLQPVVLPHGSHLLRWTGNRWEKGADVVALRDKNGADMRARVGDRRSAEVLTDRGCWVDLSDDCTLVIGPAVYPGGRLKG